MSHNTRCITIGSSITVQGQLIRTLDDGRAVIDGGNGHQVGRLVERAAFPAALQPEIRAA